MILKNKTQKGFIATVMAVVIVMFMSIVMAGCSSTELVDTPRPTETQGQTITLNISCPEAAQTRADNDHVLRYIAVLYRGVELGRGELIDRKENIVNNGEKSMAFTFKVPEDNYNCIVFADYIPVDNVQTDENGYYKDKYYNTQNINNHIYMRSFIDFATASNNEERISVGWRCFNNENYDCFIYTNNNIVKEAPDTTIKVDLHRIVSRVAVKSNTDFPEGVTSVKSVSFNKIDFFHQYDISPNSSSVSTSHAGSFGIVTTNSPYVITYEDNYNNKEDELFYFYTFGSKNEGSRTTLYDFEFSITFDNGSVYEAKIPQNKIEPIENYKITAKGPFLSAPSPTLGDLTLLIPTTEIEDWDKDIEVEW